jgi:hypothetical protein
MHKVAQPQPKTFTTEGTENTEFFLFFSVPSVFSVVKN